MNIGEELDYEPDDRERYKALLLARFAAARDAAHFLQAQNIEPASFVQLQAVALHDYLRAIAEDAADWALRASGPSAPQQTDTEAFGLSSEDLRLGLLINMVEKAAPGTIYDAVWDRVADGCFIPTWEKLMLDIHEAAAQQLSSEGEPSQQAAPRLDVSTGKERLDPFGPH